MILRAASVLPYRDLCVVDYVTGAKRLVTAHAVPQTKGEWRPRREEAVTDTILYT